MIYPWQAGSVATGLATTRTKPTDQTVSNTSLTDDSVLVSTNAVAEDKFFEFDVIAKLDSTGSYSFQVNIPGSGAVAAISYRWISSAPTFGTVAAGATKTLTVGAANEVATLKIRGFLLGAGGAGNIQLQFCAFGGGTVTNKAGSKVKTWH